MRKKIVAGNHKMNLSKTEASALVAGINSYCFDEAGKELMIFPPAIYLDDAIQHKGHLKVGAQNGHFEPKGAFTGEISYAQLKSLGCDAVLIGHSERRDIFGESNALLKSKIDGALENEITPVFCCGEPLNIREAKTQKAFVIKQLEESVFHLSKEDFLKVVVAYEPIWAIGTGVTASSAQAEQMHKDIRQAIADKYDAEVAGDTTILYGGSCKPSNAEELFNCENVDGGLIGGASLKVDDFLAIANAL